MAAQQFPPPDTAPPMPTPPQTLRALPTPPQSPRTLHPPPPDAPPPLGLRPRELAAARDRFDSLAAGGPAGSPRDGRLESLASTDFKLVGCLHKKRGGFGRYGSDPWQPRHFELSADGTL